MPSVSLIDPYSQKAEEIARRQRMAQALQESGSQVLQMPTMPGVAISPLAGLAKVFESGLGAYQESKAQKDYAKLQNDYRTNYNNQLGEMARLISAPEVKGVAGQKATIDIPGWTRPLGLDTSVSGGTEMFEDVAPQGKPAIAPVEARPAGYISAADLEKIDIPEVKQLLMAKYLKQFEPQQVTLGENQRLLERTGGGGFKEVIGLATAAEKSKIGNVNPSDYTPESLAKFSTSQKYSDLVLKPTKTPATASLSPLGKLQSERAAIAASNPNDPRLTSYDSAIANETRNVAAERLAWEQKNPDYKQVTVDMKDGSKALMKMDREGRVTPLTDVAGEAVVSAAPVKKIRMDVTNPDGSTKTILTDENDPKFKEGFVTKGPDYVSITEVNEKGETVIRQVEQNDPILKTGYVKPLEGFFGQLQALGVPIKDWRSNPALFDMVNRYFVKGVGGADVESVAGYDLQKMKVLAELGYQGIRVPQAVLDKLNIKATPGLLGGAATNALPLPADRDKKKLINGQTYQTDQGPARWDAALGQFVK
jgi:hypothetical protein